MPRVHILLLARKIQALESIPRTRSSLRHDLSILYYHFLQPHSYVNRWLENTKSQSAIASVGETPRPQPDANESIVDWSRSSRKEKVWRELSKAQSEEKVWREGLKGRFEGKAWRVGLKGRFEGKVWREGLNAKFEGKVVLQERFQENLYRGLI